MKAMKRIKMLQDRLRGLNDAVARYPLTAAFLTAAVIINAYSINKEEDYSKFLITFVVGAFLMKALCLHSNLFLILCSFPAKCINPGGG